jgi:hypothetical protein
LIHIPKLSFGIYLNLKGFGRFQFQAPYLLGIPTVIYTTVPIEYPATSSDGVAIVQGWNNPMDAFNNVD